MESLQHTAEQSVATIRSRYVAVCSQVLSPTSAPFSAAYDTSDEMLVGLGWTLWLLVACHVYVRDGTCSSTTNSMLGRWKSAPLVVLSTYVCWTDKLRQVISTYSGVLLFAVVTALCWLTPLTIAILKDHAPNRFSLLF